MTFDKFPQNKYTKWYKNLVESRKEQSRKLFETERHHIFPVSIFGNNKEIVHLTIREHYIAHLILINMYRTSQSKDFNKMLYAFDMMSITRDNIRINSILFENIKQEVAKAHSDRFSKYWSDPENREAQSQRRKEHLRDPENYKKMCETNKKISEDPEWIVKRKANQKRLHEDPEYKKKRLDAMNTKESKLKSKATIQANIDKMTPEERKERFSHPMSEERKKQQSLERKGAKMVFNPETNEKTKAKKEEVQEYLDKGWILWTSIPYKERKNINIIDYTKVQNEI